MYRGRTRIPVVAAMPVIVVISSSCLGIGPGCRPLQDAVALPEELTESSGVAISSAHPGVFWSHDDGRAPWLYAVASDGRLVGKTRLLDIVPRDLEDMALSPCGTGSCIYVGDLGDNAERRDTLYVHRLREPDPVRDTTATPETFRIVLPDGPRDIEALFVLPGERIHLVSKGRSHAVSVYRYPGPLRTDATVVMEEVQRLSDGPRAPPRQVTGAEATPDGETIVIRTYETLQFYRMVADTLAAADDGVVNLRSLREAQGEGVGIAADGTIALTSEAGPVAPRGSIALMRCRLGAA